MDSVYARLRRIGDILIISILGIICLGLAVYYLGEDVKQRDLLEQITNLTLTVSKPMPDSGKLLKEYQEASGFLLPITVPDALDIIVYLAQESGIDIDFENKKLLIPPPKVLVTKVGGIDYEVTTFGDITARGDYDTVMKFISSLESNKQLPTMVVTKVTISTVELEAKDKEKTETETIGNLNVAIYTKPTK